MVMNFLLEWWHIQHSTVGITQNSCTKFQHILCINCPQNLYYNYTPRMGKEIYKLAITQSTYKAREKSVRSWTPLSWSSYTNVLNSHFKSTGTPKKSLIKCKEMLEDCNLFHPCQDSTYSWYICRYNAKQSIDVLLTSISTQPQEH